MAWKAFFSISCSVILLATIVSTYIYLKMDLFCFHFKNSFTEYRILGWQWFSFFVFEHSKVFYCLISMVPLWGLLLILYTSLVHNGGFCLFSHLPLSRFSPYLFFHNLAKMYLGVDVSGASFVHHKRFWNLLPQMRQSSS